jgi:hypothetical protein
VAKLTKAEAARLNGQKGGRPPKVEDASLGFLPDPDEVPATVGVLLNPFQLTPHELKFVTMFCGVAEFNASKAYELAGYKPHRENAARLARKPRVAAAIAARIEEDATRLKAMGGDEALERLTVFARGADIRAVFPDEPRIAALSDVEAACVKAVTRTKHGLRIEFYDAMHANEVIAKGTGKLKETVQVAHTLEQIMAMANAPAPNAPIPLETGA